MCKAVLVFLMTCVALAPGAGEAGRAIPDDNLAYPVLIKLDTGLSGSGFFFNTGSGTYLVTASHVLIDPLSGKLKGQQAKLLSYPRNPEEKGRNTIQLELPVLLEAKRILSHPTEDVAVVYIADEVGSADAGGRRLNMVAGASLLEKAPSGILGVGLDNVKRFSDVLTANSIYVFGYPTSLGMEEVPQIDPLRPLLRFGIIAGTNPDRKTIILDCPSYPGNSGGPVLEVEQFDMPNPRFKLIGVVSQFVPFEETWENNTHKYKVMTISNSGYAVAVSMDPVLDLIEMGAQE